MKIASVGEIASGHHSSIDIRSEATALFECVSCHNETMKISLNTIVRGLGFIYLFAFLSLVSQIIPLFGSEGIVPIAESLPFYERQIENKWLQLPSLFWLGASDVVLKAVVWLGVLLSMVMIKGGRFSWVGTVGCWVLYLSIVNLGMPFMSFQWDILLLEAGFFAILGECGVAPIVMVWAFRLLAFRVMFASGVVKWASGDMLWRNFEAMTVHYVTQPIPHIGGWYADKLPAWFQKFSTVMVFVIELIVPLFMFGPRRMRQVCAAAFMGLMTLVALTGNYTFFNLLMMVLSLSVLIDAPLPKWKLNKDNHNEYLKGSQWKWIGNSVVVCFIVLGVLHEADRFIPSFKDPLSGLRQSISGFRVINGYGLFAVMTPHRDEISIQGSMDGKTWTPYVFKYKPEKLNKSPQWLWPHQPRLDWQMWFAALSSIERSYWLQRFAMRLLEGNAVVTQLLEQDPFFETPPNLIRMERYRYTYTTLKQRQETGEWWQRDYIGAYCFPVALPRKISPHE